MPVAAGLLPPYHRRRRVLTPLFSVSSTAACPWHPSHRFSSLLLAGKDKPGDMTGAAAKASCAIPLK